MSVIVTEISAPVLRVRMYEALQVYARAMGYPRGIEHNRAPMWAEHILRGGWRAVAAFDCTGRSPGAGADTDTDTDTDQDSQAQAQAQAQATIVTPTLSHEQVRVPDSAPMVGIAYGYHGTTSYWWDRQVRAGLRKTGQNTDMLKDYFELTEIHVLPAAQGRGTGARMITELLSGVEESRVLLSTPEVPDEENRAWTLYRRLGFEDLLRDFMFLGDRRAFAVLARGLPLP